MKVDILPFAGFLKEASKLSVLCVLTEDDLKNHVTAGENEGKVLEHTSVVRKLKALGQLDSFESLDSITTSLTYEADWNSENFNLVTIVQSQTDGEIVGVTERQL